MRQVIAFIGLATVLHSAAIAAPGSIAKSPPPPLMVVPPLSAPPARVITSAPAITPIDPERLTLGREIAHAFLPQGSVQEMVSSLSNLRASMMKQMFGLNPKDFGAKGTKDGNQTLGELIRQKDPNYEERMAITNRVMMEGFGKVLSDFEPQLRESMAHAYARRFTKAELSDLASFLRTASGKSFASQLMSMTNDPDYQKALSDLAPKIMQAMPEMMAKIKKATADLPLPPSDEKAKPALVPST